jgi:hypothetical protein
MDIDSIIEAAQQVSYEYGCHGNHDSDLISNAFERFVFYLEQTRRQKEKEHYVDGIPL